MESKRFFSFQVCQAAPPSARSALHRTEVPGAPVFLQTHRRHTYRHFPHGDAGSTASNHMTKVLLHVNTPQRTLNPIITKKKFLFFTKHNVKKKKNIQKICIGIFKERDTVKVKCKSTVNLYFVHRFYQL